MHSNLLRSFLLLLLFSNLALLAQGRAPRTDLPFEIDEKKRMSERDVEKKKEGGYFTGLPLVN